MTTTPPRHEPPIRLVTLNGDTTGVRALQRGNNPDAGWLVTRARPDTRNLGWLAADLLAALGKRHDIAGATRNIHDDWAAVTVWLAAHHITDVVVIDTHLLPPDVVDALLARAALARARLWLCVDQQTPQALWERLADWPASHATADELHAHLPDTDHDTDPDAPDAHPAQRWPEHVPASDWPTFRADAQRLLPAAHAAVVDACYRDTFTRAAQHYDTRPDLDEDDLADLLRRDLLAASCAAEMTTRLRAWQAAALPRWLVRVDLATLLASGVTDQAAAAHDPATWQRLRAYRDPHRAVICALTAAGVDHDTLTRLTVADADDSGVTLSDGSRVDVHPHASVFLTAQLLARRADGAADTDPLLRHYNGDPLTDRAAVRVLSDAHRDLGVAVFHRSAERRATPTRHWLRRRGVHLAPLRPDLTRDDLTPGAAR